MPFRPFRMLDQILIVVRFTAALMRAAYETLEQIMSAAESIQKAIQELKEETAKSIQQHRDDAKALAEMTQKLAAGVQGQDPTVDIAGIAMQIHQAAQDLANGLTSAHSDSADVKTANQDQSVVQGGGSTGPDVVSASSPGTIVPEATPDESSQEVPKTLGGGAMPVVDVTIPAKEPGEPLPAKEGEEPKPAEPSVPSVEDVPSKVSDTAPDSTKQN